MVQSDDIFRQLNKNRKRTPKPAITDESLASMIGAHVRKETNTPGPVENPVQTDVEPTPTETPVEPAQAKTEYQEPEVPAVESKPDVPVAHSQPQATQAESAQEVVAQAQTVVAEPEPQVPTPDVPKQESEPVTQVEPDVEVVDGIAISGHKQTPAKDPVGPSESRFNERGGTTAPVTSYPRQTVQHPEYEVERPDIDEAFQKMSPSEKLTFGDIFVEEDGLVQFNADHQRSVAKNLSKGVINQVVKDLLQKYKDAEATIGQVKYSIRESNAVFTNTTSLMRFLLLNSLEDENTALQLARQLFLEKHPDGESKGFKHEMVRTDERDIYAMLLVAKKNPEKDLAEKVEELIHTLEYTQETTALTNRKMLNHSEQASMMMNGMNIAVSLLVLERLGLTTGGLPNSLDELHGFMTQDGVVKLSDLLGNDIATEVESRKRTIARDERMRAKPSRNRTNPPKSMTRRQPSGYNRNR